MSVEPRSAPSGERAAAIALLVLSAAFTALAAGIEPAPLGAVRTLGPRSFPLAVGIAGMGLSLALLLPGARARGDVERRLAGDWPRALALCAITLCYAAALPRLGFALATAGFLAAAFGLLGERRPLALAAIPIAVAVGSLAALRGALGVHLPEPLLEAVWARLSSP
jgi:putative tricarboxylic transport membrane protein